MPDLVDRLAYQVASRIRELGFDEPNRRVVGILLEIAYLGTLRSEEGRFVKGSLTFANSKRPDVEPPFIRRADYPAFTKFESPEILTVQTLVKLARAIDRWSGSIAVYATRRYEIVAWGVVDQLVQQNVRWHREAGWRLRKSWSIDGHDGRHRRYFCLPPAAAVISRGVRFTRHTINSLTIY